MNERIKELIEQAGIESYPAKLLVNTDEEGKVSSKWEIPLEKFAELIVRECAKVCRDQPNVYALKADRDNCAIAIEQHFGVEECWCESCKPNTMTDMRMILCQICGNKRCPHATNHIYECTNSNEPGQKGSSWENYKVGVEE